MKFYVYYLKRRWAKPGEIEAACVVDTSAWSARMQICAIVSMELHSAWQDPEAVEVTRIAECNVLSEMPRILITSVKQGK